jgi:hypothetical protein
MNQADREYLRKLQDKVIESTKKTGLPDDYKTNMRDNNNHDLTIADLKKYLYPQFKQVFEDYIRE